MPQHDLTAKYILKRFIKLPRKLIGEEKEYIKNLFLNHPKAQAKSLNTEPVDFWVDFWNHGCHNGVRCFYVERVDGTKESFSYRKCVDNQRRHILDVFRKSIHDQIVNFKKSKKPKFICDITNESLSLKDVEVDHCYPYNFSKILDEFLTQENLLDKPYSFYETQRLEGKEVLEEPLLSKWKKFHEEKAVLRIVSREAHKELHRKQRIIDEGN